MAPLRLARCRLLVVSRSLRSCGCAPRRRHVRPEQVRHVQRHAHASRAGQPALVALLRRQGSGRQGVAPPLRDAIGARAAPIGLGQGTVSRRRQPIVVEAAPDKVDPNSCYLNTIRFNDGTHMDRYGQYVKGTGGALTEVRGDRSRRRPPRGGRSGVRRASRTSPATGRPSRSSWPTRAAPAADSCRSARCPRSTRPAAPARGGGGRRGAPPAGPRLYGGTELTDAGTQAAAAFAPDGQPALPLRDDQHHLRLDVRRPGQPHHAEQGHHRASLYGQMGLKRTIYMNMKDASRRHEADARRPLDRPLGGRHARRRHRSVPAGRAERAGPQQRQAARRRTLHARSEDDEADARLRSGRSDLPERASTRART